MQAFERLFAEFCKSPHCIALNSGTDALSFALQAMGVKGNDEVITSPFTFIATAEAIRRHARLVLADVDPDTFTIAPDEVEERITAHTRVLAPVHIFGLPASMTELIFLAQRNDLVIVEDACQAHGASIFNQRVGTFGECAAFSFYPTKNLGAFGDAGAVTTGQSETAERIRLLRNHGQTGPYEHEREGWNSRMDALQASLLSLKLKFIDAWIGERRRLAGLFRKGLQGVGAVSFQKEPENYLHVYYMLAARVERREELMAHLLKAQIETRVVYPFPLHLLKAYRDLGYHCGDFPVAEALCKNILSFPLYPGLSDEHVGEITQVVRRFYGE